MRKKVGLKDKRKKTGNKSSNRGDKHILNENNRNYCTKKGELQDDKKDGRKICQIL